MALEWPFEATKETRKLADEYWRGYCEIMGITPTLQGSKPTGGKKMKLKKRVEELEYKIENLTDLVSLLKERKLDKKYTSIPVCEGNAYPNYYTDIAFTDVIRAILEHLNLDIEIKEAIGEQVILKKVKK